METKVQSEITMTTPIHKLCPKTSHYAVSGVLVTPSQKGAWTCATDGHALAIVHENRAIVDEKSIIPGSIFASRKSQELTFNGDFWHNNNNSKSAPPMNGNFPRLADVLPDIDAEPYFEFTIDAAKLKAVADAIDSDGKVTLFVRQNPYKANLKPIALVGNRGIGAIMPVESSDKGRGHYRKGVDDFKSENE